ncbi:hypothetical protein CF319_g7850 [Tilletia indica]|nr:hypothetical protein CF319_g7850 [Tilletia indica]
MDLESAAADRFFATPELIDILLGYLSRDRVDLLALAMVSKRIRIQALRVWAKYLDLPVSAASRRFKFLEANTDMLAHIRYVRVRSDVREQGIFGSTIGYTLGLDDRRLRLKWVHLSKILDMIANRVPTALDLPFLDVTIAPEDPVQIPRELMKRVVALRIISGKVGAPEGPDRVAPASDTNQEESPAPPTEEGDATEDEPVRPWNKVAEIIQAASEGPGLHTFQIYEPGPDTDEIDIDGYLCWSLLIERHVRTLQSLSISAESESLPEELSTVSFSQLRDLNFRQSDGDSELIQALLDHHPTLRKLYINAYPPHNVDPPGITIHFRQTFPDLSDVYITPPFPGPEFAERHPKVIRILKTIPTVHFDPHAAPEFETSTEYPKQRFALVFNSESLQEMVAAGQRLSHIYVGGLGHYQELDYYLPVFRASPEIAQALTCLELDVEYTQLGEFLQSFDPTIFKNLAEVSINMDQSESNRQRRRTPSVPPPSVESKIATAISHFVPARSLRVLRISQGRAARCLSTDILLDHEFPPALEYVGWLEPPERVPQYFRFVSSDPFGRVVETESGGKRGRLQRVPSIFRAKITSYGVWERPLDPNFQMTVLDHISGPPTLVLS